MEKLKISKEMQVWFIGPVLLLWFGIFFTGFSATHWLVYVPAFLALFALFTGVCPGMWLIRNTLEKYGNFI